MGCAHPAVRGDDWLTGHRPYSPRRAGDACARCNSHLVQTCPPATRASYPDLWRAIWEFLLANGPAQAVVPEIAVGFVYGDVPVPMDCNAINHLAQSLAQPGVYSSAMSVQPSSAVDTSFGVDSDLVEEEFGDVDAAIYAGGVGDPPARGSFTSSVRAPLASSSAGSTVDEAEVRLLSDLPTPCGAAPSHAPPPSSCSYAPSPAALPPPPACSGSTV